MDGVADVDNYSPLVHISHVLEIDFIPGFR